ncbi:hypothetical protein A4L20_22265 [Salmonella enterica subsp. enterica serovar Telelkebir]|nr:hypothetical protein [Salmonella enterica subsp. enterica serovar Newport]ECY5873100.1 hypothetical protein [Salmonella enterica subsp. enterica serovar Telelkebir]MIN81590.1 hypothetical protein [Salmonella enterica subsp. enterica]ECZ9744534.1 hypothetical protein [Salmonella enterica subsp. enterica serovar Telelkebir]EHB3482202.1 hypothetical protein [Salmonella enterica subsp. enterica serovar Newport]
MIITGFFYWLVGKRNNRIWWAVFAFVFFVCGRGGREAYAEANIFESIVLDKVQQYIGQLDNNVVVPFQFSGTTGHVADTYFVSPNCVTGKIFPADVWLVYPEYVDDTLNNIRLVVELNGDSVVTSGYKGKVVGQISGGYYHCTMGYHYVNAVIGNYNVKFNVRVTPLDSSRPIPREWTSSIPLWITDTFNREGPNIGWGNVITKQRTSGFATINFKEIDYCYTSIIPDVFTHEVPPIPGKYRSEVSKLTSVCNGNHKLRYRLMTTGVGDNNNSVNIGPGLESNILINNHVLPEDGITVDLRTGVENILSMISELNVSNGVSPGYYSKSVLLVVDIE